MKIRYLLGAMPLGLLAMTACQVPVTPDGYLYAMHEAGSVLSLTNTQSGNNEREFLWNSQQPAVANSSACTQWVSGSGIAQNGIAFRVRSDTGGWDSVVIERNIYGYAFWNFVVIYFHGGTNHTTQFDTGPQVSLASYLGTGSTDVFPLRMCAQINGNTLSFAVAKGADQMAPVGTPGRGATFTLDPTMTPAAGTTATYVAHLPSGATSIVDDVTINGEPAPMPDVQHPASPVH